MLVNEQYVAPHILRLAQGCGVKLLIANSAPTPNQVQLINPAQARRLLEINARQNYDVDFCRLSGLTKSQAFRYPFSLQLLMP